MANPKKIEATVKDIIPYGRGVYKLIFQLERSFPRFKAGQFTHLTLDSFDPATGFWPESRVFSIASCSEDRREVSIVYSVKGEYTTKMESALKKGLTVWLKAPYGDFIISNFLNNNEDVVLIAGGTGVSPFIPFLEKLKEGHFIQLYYGLKNENLFIFEKEIEKTLDNEYLKLNLFLEEPSGLLWLNKNVVIENGFLSIDKILSSVRNIKKSVYFISGPPDMIKLFTEQLREHKIPEDKIIIDQWS